ncbi:MAG: hypothetical protein II544_03925 [Spirochaetales bacterium]|nr:hypothetical protein [Spirochaetales bacterium]
MTSEKKKGTPEGAPSQHKYGTTPGVKNQILAQIWFEQIGDDSSKPLKRPKDPAVDRAFRRLIQEANNNGDYIINLGEGYYRPGRDEFVDLAEYLLKESARAREILSKCAEMRKAFNRRYYGNI